MTLWSSAKFVYHKYIYVCNSIVLNKMMAFSSELHPLLLLRNYIYKDLRGSKKMELPHSWLRKVDDTFVVTKQHLQIMLFELINVHL